MPNPTGDSFVLQNAGLELNEGHVRVALPANYHPKDGVAGFKGQARFVQPRLQALFSERADVRFAAKRGDELFE